MYLTMNNDNLDTIEPAMPTETSEPVESPVPIESIEPSEPSAAPASPSSPEPSDNLEPSMPSMPAAIADILQSWLATAMRESREAAELKQSEIDARLAEAERNGYLRGRNEAISAELARPKPFANPAHESEPLPSADDIFLAAYRDTDFWK